MWLSKFKFSSFLTFLFNLVFVRTQVLVFQGFQFIAASGIEPFTMIENDRQKEKIVFVQELVLQEPSSRLLSQL